MKKILIMLISTSLVFNSAFAARIGKGKYSGRQRVTQSRNYQTTNQQNMQQSAPPQQQGRGMGKTIGAVAAGAAVGAVGGYMLGKSMNSGSESQGANVQASAPVAATDNVTQGNIPWGIIGILAVLLIIGVTIFRRKPMPSNDNARFQQAAGMNNQNNNSFTIPKVNSQRTAQNSQTVIIPQARLMVDGNETSYFLRQVKGMFLHIQSMNNKDNISEIEKYLTPELFNDIKEDTVNNQSVADFTELQCELVDDAIEDNAYVASVLFSGMVSEEVNSKPETFKETWNFVKPINGEKWIVAGIQQ